MEPASITVFTKSPPPPPGPFPGPDEACPIFPPPPAIRLDPF